MQHVAILSLHVFPVINVSANSANSYTCHSRDLIAYTTHIFIFTYGTEFHQFTQINDFIQMQEQLDTRRQMCPTCAFSHYHKTCSGRALKNGGGGMAGASASYELNKHGSATAAAAATASIDQSMTERHNRAHSTHPSYSVAQVLFWQQVRSTSADPPARQPTFKGQTIRQPRTNNN